MSTVARDGNAHEGSWEIIRGEGYLDPASWFPVMYSAPLISATTLESCTRFIPQLEPNLSIPRTIIVPNIFLFNFLLSFVVAQKRGV